MCERTLSQLTAADRPFVTLFLNIELELAGAEAGLGQLAEAQARLHEIRSFHAASDNPLTRGRIHEAFARVAVHAQDWPTFREHLDAMRSWYTRTSSAALVARVDRLRLLDPIQSNRPAPATTEDGTLSQADRQQPTAQNENAERHQDGERTVCTVTDVTHNADRPDSQRVKT
jgi:hypothetical protein